jgi:transposase
MRHTKRVLTDDQWGRIAPLLPPHRPSANGGRPWAADRECLEGILWLLRSGARWRDIPIDLPSGSACWRRLRDWAGEGVLPDIHAILIEDLDATDKGPTAVVEEYDPAANRWTRRAPMPTPRGFFGAAAVGGAVYTIAGRVRGPAPVESYDPGADRWQRLDPVPGGERNRFGTAGLGGKVYVLGGEFQGDRALPRSVLCFTPE